MLKHIPRRLCSDRYVSAVNSRGRHRATATLLPSHAPRTGMSEMGIQHDLEAIWRQLEDCERTLKRGDAAGARRELDDAVLDVGCGPADVLRYLPEVDYVGIDRSSTYVPEASRRHRATTAGSSSIR